MIYIVDYIFFIDILEYNILFVLHRIYVYDITIRMFHKNVSLGIRDKFLSKVTKSYKK